ncbi:hypothetical protein F8B43_1560 [Methylorubrum populi]|uniref:Uncharacterized protein n=1 Tax=Methylorubrum populi TaxID=223967 RepID=A0A833N3K0_9HYPH|nr:hypothetical protein F8B43_1560 [Methylorubrum populi]
MRLGENARKRSAIRRAAAKRINPCGSSRRPDDVTAVPPRIRPPGPRAFPRSPQCSRAAATMQGPS